MSAGTRIYPVRLRPELVELTEETIARRNEWTRDEPWTFSEFIRVALVEKIKKMARSRKPYRRKRAEGTCQQ